MIGALSEWKRISDPVVAECLGPDYDIDPIRSHLEQSGDLAPKLVQTITSAYF